MTHLRADFRIKRRILYDTANISPHVHHVHVRAQCMITCHIRVHARSTYIYMIVQINYTIKMRCDALMCLRHLTVLYM